MIPDHASQLKVQNGRDLSIKVIVNFKRGGDRPMLLTYKDDKVIRVFDIDVNGQKILNSKVDIKSDDWSRIKEAPM